MAMDITEHLTKIMGEIIDINGCGYPPLSSPIGICWGPLDLFFWGSFWRLLATNFVDSTHKSRSEFPPAVTASIKFENLGGFPAGLKDHR
jgi:hypothetical protein